MNVAIYSAIVSYNMVHFECTVDFAMFPNLVCKLCIFYNVPFDTHQLHV